MRFVITSNSNHQSDFHVSDYVFNKMTEEEQTNYICLRLAVENPYGTSIQMLQRLEDTIAIMQSKYDPS